jgi:hypothetical protein
MATHAQPDDTATVATLLVQLLQRIITAPDLAYLSEAEAACYTAAAINQVQEFCDNVQLKPAMMQAVMQVRVKCLQLLQAPVVRSGSNF